MKLLPKGGSVAPAIDSLSGTIRGQISFAEATGGSPLTYEAWSTLVVEQYRGIINNARENGDDLIAKSKKGGVLAVMQAQLPG